MIVNFYDLVNNDSTLQKYDTIEVDNNSELLNEIFINKLHLNQMLYSHIYLGIYSEDNYLDKFIRLYIGEINNYKFNDELIKNIIKTNRFMVIYNKNENSIFSEDRLLRNNFYLFAVYNYIDFDEMYICINNEIQKCPEATPSDLIQYT